jgi:hypothetical protein
MRDASAISDFVHTYLIREAASVNEAPGSNHPPGSLIALNHRPSLRKATTMNDPFARLPVVPNFTVTSTDVTDGQALPLAQMSGIFEVPGGKELSPQLSWSGAPAETKSYTVTM